MAIALARNAEISVDVTPQECAAVFASYSDLQQAEFFNELAKQVAKWDKPFAFQLQALSESHKLDSQGRFIMSQIGSYAYRT